VRDPRDRFQIDALFVHLVKRRKVTKLLHFCRDEFGDVVDLFIGREATEPKSNARVRELIAHA
jgi:hypothetical protein